RRYFSQRISETGVSLLLGTPATPERLAGFDAVVVATGVVPRPLDLPGHDHPKVVGYADVLSGRATVGRRAAIIGAGGIGFDVAAFLVQDGPSPSLDPALWMQEWGVDPASATPGGRRAPRPGRPAREAWLRQRSPGRRGARLGKTTGWIHRATLRAKGVHMHGGVAYHQVDDAGLHVTLDGEPRVLPVDHVVVCAGQVSERTLAGQLAGGHPEVHVIGGAELAAELDAKRAIDQGARLAARLWPRRGPARPIHSAARRKCRGPSPFRQDCEIRQYRARTFSAASSAEPARPASRGVRARAAKRQRVPPPSPTRQAVRIAVARAL